MLNRGIKIHAALCFCLAFTTLTGDARAQSPPQQRPKLKDFGSSLKRLKWDPKKNAAVETKRKKEKEKGKDSDEEEVVRVETTLVVCDVLVLYKQGRSVRGLTRDDFIVTEGGQPQEVGTFALGDNATVPRSIVLIIDNSFSQLGFIKSSVEAAKALVDKLGPRDRMAIVTNEVKLLVDFTQDKARLKEQLESLTKEAKLKEQFESLTLTKEASSRHRVILHLFSRGAHYSALLATLRELFGDEDLRPIIIFQAHGNEASLFQQPIGLSVPPSLSPDEREAAQSWLLRLRQYTRPHMRQFSIKDVYAAAEKSRATIYTIIPDYRLVGLSPDERIERTKDREGRAMSEWAEAVPGGAGPWPFRKKKHWELVLDSEAVLEQQIALIELSKLTGGWADFLEEPSQAAGIYSRIFSNINRRYVIGYYRSNKERDGTRREVKIEVRGHPEYTVWGRKSYYAPGPQE